MNYADSHRNPRETEDPSHREPMPALSRPDQHALRTDVHGDTAELSEGAGHNLAARPKPSLLPNPMKQLVQSSASPQNIGPGSASIG